MSGDTKNATMPSASSILNEWRALINAKNVRYMLEIIDHPLLAEYKFILLNEICVFLPYLLTMEIDGLSCLATLLVDSPFQEEYKSVADKIADKLRFRSQNSDVFS